MLLTGLYPSNLVWTGSIHPDKPTPRVSLDEINKWLLRILSYSFARRPPLMATNSTSAGFPSCTCFHRRKCTSVRASLRDSNELSRPAFQVARRELLSTTLSLSLLASLSPASAEPAVGFREYINNFNGYTFIYPKTWIQVRGAGADVFFRDPVVLDENISVEISSPSSSRYLSVEDLGSPEKAAEKVLRQYLTEFMSTRLGVKRESNVLTASQRVADDGKIYYQVEVNIKSYASNNELAVMPQDRIQKLEWDRRYLSVLGVENKRLYELRLQTPEKVFQEEEKDLRAIMESFRAFKSAD